MVKMSNEKYKRCRRRNEEKGAGTVKPVYNFFGSARMRRGLVGGNVGVNIVVLARQPPATAEAPHQKYTSLGPN